MQDLTHKILMVLTALTIIGEASTIFIWLFNPQLPLGQARTSLVVDYTVAIANDVVFAVLNSLVLVWIYRKSRRGPLFLIAVAVANRVVTYPLFVTGGFTVFAAWTVVLVIFAYLDYRKMSKK